METNNSNKVIGAKELCNLILVSCISADNNYDIESCNKNLEYLNSFEQMLNSDLKLELTENEIKFYKTKIIDARRIIQDDIKSFNN